MRVGERGRVFGGRAFLLLTRTVQVPRGRDSSCPASTRSQCSAPSLGESPACSRLPAHGEAEPTGRTPRGLGRLADLSVLVCQMRIVMGLPVGTGPGASPTASKLTTAKGGGDCPTGPAPAGSWDWRAGWQQGPLHSLWDPGVGRLQGMRGGGGGNTDISKGGPSSLPPLGRGEASAKALGWGAWLAGGTVARHEGRGGQGRITRHPWPRLGRLHIVP